MQVSGYKQCFACFSLFLTFQGKVGLSSKTVSRGKLCPVFRESVLKMSELQLCLCMLTACFPKDCILEVFASKSAAGNFPREATYGIPEGLNRRRKEEKTTTNHPPTNSGCYLCKLWSNPHVQDMSLLFLGNLLDNVWFAVGFLPDLIGSPFPWKVGYAM